MFSDGKSSFSPPKGKGREEDHLNSSWFDFSLFVQPQRYQLKPVQWARTSTIFTAHSHQPFVLGRLFPSSRQFILPSPAILSAPNSYEPPTIVSICPDGNWLFAYFPGLVDAVAVMWKRGLQIDEWYVKDSWNIPRSASLVAVDWTSAEREWTIDSDAVSRRLPPRGPHAPLSTPILLLVAQTHHLTLCYLHPYSPSVKFMSCSLTQSSKGQENRGFPIHDMSHESGNTKICSKAAIGLGYNESSILIAMRSRVPPNPIATSTGYSTADLNLPMDLAAPNFPPSADPTVALVWNEESSIELCEVRLSFEGMLTNNFGIGITSHPLPPIHLSNTPLSQMWFICAPPQYLKPHSPRKNDKSPVRSSTIDEIENGQVYLCASLLDLGDLHLLDHSTLTSELIVYSISRNPSPSSNPSWLINRESSRSFAPDVLAFVARCTMPTSSDVDIYAGILNTSRTIPQHGLQEKDGAVGKFVVLKLPDLTDGEDWESTLIISSAGNTGGDLPLIAAVSPNDSLICSVSSSLQSTQTLIHTLPRRKNKNSPAIGSRPPLSFVIASAVRSRKSIADISHTLSHPSIPMDEMVEVLYHTISILEDNHDMIAEVRTWEFLGVVVEIYRTRALHAARGSDREMLAARWQTAHDMCSIVACNMAFEDCKKDEAYDLEAVWQLVGLSGWSVDFFGRLLRHAVLLASNTLASQPTAESHNDLSGWAPLSLGFELQTSPDLSILLHLVQPYALSNLHGVLKHVKRFRAYLGTLSPATENAQIVKDVLVDLVDCSGIDLTALDPVLAECVQYASAVTLADSRRSLALCCPTDAMAATVRKVIQKLANSSILDKPTLFIKTSDLMDGTLLSERVIKEKDRDVVSKGLLVKGGPTLHCQGCGGRSEVGGNIKVAGHISWRWRAWEKAWTTRCICGGTWTIGPP